MKYGSAALVAVFSIACGSDPSKPSSSSVTAMKDDPSKGIVCMKQTLSGTIVRKNVCTTAAEREAARQRGAQQLEADVVPSVGR